MPLKKEFILVEEKMKNKVLYIATTADHRNRLDGETVKCKLLRDYLKEINEIKVTSIDTDNWKKHTLKLAFLIFFNYFKCDKIVISSADRGANIILDFLNKIKNQKPVYYFVIGGSLSKNIKTKKWNTLIYKRINKIYVEAQTLKDDLGEIEINNVEVVENFRKVKEFKNKYKEEKKVRFVYYGRVIKSKGIERAIELVKNLNLEKLKCTLDIYGQCSKEYLEEITKKFDESITYHGEIKPNNKTEYEILSQYDCFLFPTEYPGECLPGALIDSYIAGLAVLASNWKYAKEYIEDGKNGFIFKYKNYDDMFKKSKKLFNHNLLMSFKNESKKISKNYIIENVLENFKREIEK